MVRELIETPFRIGFAVAGGVLGLVKSRLPGGQTRDSSPVYRAPDPIPDPPAPVEPEASDWDEDAPILPGGPAPDDPIITDRVKTQLFGAVDAPSGAINLNVENGVVFLRGHLEDADQVEELEVLAGAVEGVVGVENLINTEPTT
jgi:hypothetical protein